MPDSMPPEALSTRMSSPPQACSTWANIAATDSASVKSAWIASASPPAASIPATTLVARGALLR